MNSVREVGVGGVLDSLAYSSVWVAAAAGALCAASSLAMGMEPPATAVGLAICGTLVVYNVDRLRDLDRDRETAPNRSAFVEANRLPLGVLAGCALLASIALAVAAGARAALVLAPVLAAGLLHRRLKRFALAKPIYVSVAWVAVTVWMPAALGESVEREVWVSALVGVTTFANVIACNLRDGEAVSSRLGPDVPLWLARGTATAGLAVGLLAPEPMRPLALLPLCTVAVLVPFHKGERYGHLVVDGALLVGALASLAWF